MDKSRATRARSARIAQGKKLGFQKWKKAVSGEHMDPVTKEQRHALIVAAFQALIVRHRHDDFYEPDSLAMRAVDLADAMVRRLGGGVTDPRTTR